jgi:hypothetical protein
MPAAIFGGALTSSSDTKSPSGMPTDSKQTMLSGVNWERKGRPLPNP